MPVAIIRVDKASSLFAAVGAGDYQAVKHYLDNGTSPDEPWSEVDDQHPPGETPLIYAVRSCHLNIATLLLNSGADVNAETHGGMTALICAAKMNQTGTMSELLTFGANPNVMYDRQPCALFYTIDHENVEAVELLLKHRANPGFVFQKRFGSIYLATSVDNYRIVELLLEYGASANSYLTNSCEMSPLSLAVGYNRVDISRLLLERGATVNAVDPCNGQTVLHKVCSSFYRSVDIVRLLIKHGCLLDRLDNEGRTALALLSQYTSLAGCQPIVRYLIQHGTRLTIVGSSSGFEWNSLYVYDVRLVRLLVLAGLNHPRPREHLMALLNYWSATVAGSNRTAMLKIGDKLEYIRSSLYDIPMALLDQARISIRMQLIAHSRGSSIRPSVQRLPLPNALKLFLMFEY